MNSVEASSAHACVYNLSKNVWKMELVNEALSINYISKQLVCTASSAARLSDFWSCSAIVARSRAVGEC